MNCLGPPVFFRISFSVFVNVGCLFASAFMKLENAMLLRPATTAGCRISAPCHTLAACNMHAILAASRDEVQEDSASREEPMREDLFISVPYATAIPACRKI